MRRAGPLQLHPRTPPPLCPVPMGPEEGGHPTHYVLCPGPRGGWAPHPLCPVPWAPRRGGHPTHCAPCPWTPRRGGHPPHCAPCPWAPRRAGPRIAGQCGSPLPGPHPSLWLLSFFPSSRHLDKKLVSQDAPGPDCPPERPWREASQGLRRTGRASDSLFPFAVASRVCPGARRWSVQSQPCGDFICILSVREAWGRVCGVGCEAQGSQLPMQSPLHADTDRLLRVGQAGAPCAGRPPAPRAVLWFSPASQVCSLRRAGGPGSGVCCVWAAFLKGWNRVSTKS